MSMTLKKGQKAFKPKFAARRAPSAQSSARPSVEPRLSQTPVPATRLDEPIIIPDQDAEPEISQETSIVQPTPQGPILESPAEKNPAPTDAPSTDNTLKRKAGVEGGPIQKRPRSETSRDVELSGVEERSQVGDGTISRSTSHETPVDARPSQNGTPQVDAIIENLLENVSAPNPSLDNTPPTSTETTNLLPDQTTSQHIYTAPQNTESRSRNSSPDVRRQPSPEVRQDNPDSIYPDPEQSGLPRSGVIVASAGLNPDGTTIGEIVPTVTLNPDGTPASNVVPAAALNPDGTPREIAQPTKTKKKAATKRRRLVQAAQADGEDVRPTIEMQVNRPRRSAGAKRARKKKEGEKPRKKRGETPEGGEDLIIDPAEMTLADLCKDLGIGEKSKQHERMKVKSNEEKQKAKERYLAKKAAAARQKAILAGEEASTIAESVEGADVDGVEAANGAVSADGADGADGVNNPPAEGDAEAAASPEGEGDPAVNPEMRLVDGRVVLDQATLAHNKQQATKKIKKKIGEIIITEDEFSKVVTSGTHMQREPAQLWDAHANALFYKALSMFGYDFEMMSKMFPNRNRRQLKLKYAKEERDNPWKIKQVMNAEKEPIDMSVFREHYREPLLPAAELMGVLEEEEAVELRREAAAKKEREEADLRKRAAIHQRQGAAVRALESMADDGQDQSAMEASAAPKPTKAPKRPKKNLHGIRRGEE